MNKEVGETVLNMEQPVIRPDDNLEKTEVDPFAKGRERIAAVSDFFAKTKERATNLVSGVGSSISRFWSKAKSFGGEAIVATLSADELAKKGIDKGMSYTKDKLLDADEWVEDKANQGINFVLDKAEDIGAAVGEKYEQVADFVKTKKEQGAQIVSGGVELSKDIAFFAKEQTVAGLEKAKTGVTERYGKIKNYAENAMMSAKMEAAKVKDAYRQKMNDLRLRRLEAELSAVVARESSASAEAQRLTKQRKDLEYKRFLLGGVSLTA